MTKPKNNCYISTNDAMQHYVMDEAEVIEYFGKDYLEDYGHHIAPKQLEMILKAQNEMSLWRKELKRMKEEQDKCR